MKRLFYLILPVFIFSCSGEPEEKASTDGFQLPDSLFAYIDLKNTFSIDSMVWDPNTLSTLYTDVSMKKAFIELDSIQKMRLLAPVSDIDSNYIVQYMDAVFVSKQKKIGDFTPIMVYLYGDDYGALHYILLDKDLRPVSNYTVYGGENGGPADGENGTLILTPQIHTFFAGDKLRTYSLTETVNPDSVAMPSLFDSVYYESQILPTGKIETKKMDSVRYEKMILRQN